jgi:hypothetical protein
MDQAAKDINVERDFYRMKFDIQSFRLEVDSSLLIPNGAVA